MGAYVNPEGESKEAFLKRQGTLVGTNNTLEMKYKDINEKDLLVVLLDNIMFTAAGICFNENEFDAFTNEEGDDRPKKYYLVNKEDLYKVSDLKDYLKPGS